MARTIETNITEEDSRIEGSLRPQCLADYIGQEKVMQNLKVYIDRQKRRETHWTMCFFMVRPD